jgi:hypothetical protein
MKLSICLLLCFSLLFVAGTISAETASRQKLVELWECYSKGDEECKQALLRYGETSLDVLIDLLVLSQKQHYSLTQEPVDLRIALLGPATELLEQRWPMNQLRNVARRNIKRIALVEEVEFGWGARPISPILASLRYSSDFADRELLGQVAITARDGAAEIAIDLMDRGLVGRTDFISEFWRTTPPKHDYSKYAFACLDPKRPKVFESAMFYLIEDERIVPRLHQLLPRIHDEKMRETVYSALWQWHEDVEARDYLFEMLSSNNDDTFEDAVYTLTDSTHSDQGPIIIPKLQDVLHGKNLKRRLFILEMLDNFASEESATIAAKAAAPFLISTNVKEAELAQKELLSIQEHSAINVLEQIAKENSDLKVKKKALELLSQWNNEKTTK